MMVDEWGESPELLDPGDHVLVRVPEQMMRHPALHLRWGQALLRWDAPSGRWLLADLRRGNKEKVRGVFRHFATALLFMLGEE